jgi:hypothetical protein
MKYLVHVKDIKNKKQFIYDTKEFFESDVDSVFNAIFTKFKASNSKLLVSPSCDNSCTFYEESVVVKNGWIWNTSKWSKNTLYVLNIIPLLSTAETKSVGVQANDDTDSDVDHDVDHDVPNDLMFRHHGYARNFLFPDNMN